MCELFPVLMPGEVSYNGLSGISQTTQHNREALGMWPTNTFEAGQILDDNYSGQILGAVGDGFTQLPWGSQANPPLLTAWQFWGGGQPAFTYTTRASSDDERNALRGRAECQPIPGSPRRPGMVCDEYPFSSSEQRSSLEAASVPSSLKLTDEDEGNGQGSDISSFNGRSNGCDISIGDSFLVIPQSRGGVAEVSAERAGYTYWICDPAS